MEIGYQKILFGKGAPIAELIAAFDGCKAVDAENNWGTPKRYTIASEVDIHVTLIPDDSVSLPDVPDASGTHAMFAALSKKYDEALARALAAEKRIKEIEGAVGGKVAAS